MVNLVEDNVGTLGLLYSAIRRVCLLPKVQCLWTVDYDGLTCVLHCRIRNQAVRCRLFQRDPVHHLVGWLRVLDLVGDDPEIHELRLVDFFLGEEVAHTQVLLHASSLHAVVNAMTIEHRGIAADIFWHEHQECLASGMVYWLHLMLEVDGHERSTAAKIVLHPPDNHPRIQILEQYNEIGPDFFPRPVSQVGPTGKLTNKAKRRPTRK